MEIQTIRELLSPLTTASSRGNTYDLLPGKTIFDVFEAVSGIPKERIVEIDRMRSHCSDYYIYADRENPNSGVTFQMGMLNNCPGDFCLSFAPSPRTHRTIGTFDGSMTE